MLVSLQTLVLYAVAMQKPLTSIALEWVILDDNELVSTIPTEIGLLSPLGKKSKKLHFIEFANITFLFGLTFSKPSFQEVLSAYSNNLTGSIPSKIGSATKLIELYLDDNMLTGEISTEIGRLESLGTQILHSFKLLYTSLNKCREQRYLP
jgi:Leucine-rich repeat (LRR) protein